MALWKVGFISYTLSPSLAPDIGYHVFGWVKNNLINTEYVCDRIKANLYTNQGKQIKHNFHIDTEQKHIVALYSVNENNGYTELETGEKIKSKRNRLTIFDGSIKHKSVTQDNTNFRINYNFNFMVGDND